MMTTGILVLFVLLLAYSNGANDNIKGAATLYGSTPVSYRRVLTWATLTTLAGGLLSIYLARNLVITFSGAGLIESTAFSPVMLAAIAAAAAATVFLATVLGMPTSTTHALTGALVGVALATESPAIHWDVLLVKFAQPLLLSPLLAVVAATVLYPLLHRLRLTLGIGEQTCICIGEEAPQPVTLMSDGTALLSISDDKKPLTLRIDDNSRCIKRYDGHYFGVSTQSMVDMIHWISSGAVCFARAVNDTPKIAALLLASGVIGGQGKSAVVMVLITSAVVIGGLLQSRKVAETMSHNITRLNTGQGLTANIITATLVLGASHIGVPVSTTHVSCGSIFGISAVNGNRNWSVITGILTTWVTTLPMGLVLGALIYRLI